MLPKFGLVDDGGGQDMAHKVKLLSEYDERVAHK
jgi:hypothetical protein